MTQLKIGVIGTGSISNGTCRAFVDHDHAQLVAAADPSEERLGQFCDTFDIDRRYRASAELVADEDVDAVYIAVPNKFHAQYAVDCLRSGKHTLLEKPFAMNIDEANSVAVAARESDRIFMVGMNQRFSPAVQNARAIVQRGDIGDVFHAKAYWRRRAGIPRIGSWFTQKAIAGGGGLLDIGVHMIDVALHVMDKFDASSVYGSTYTKFGNRGLGDGGWGSSETSDAPFDVDDFATALVKFDDDCTLQIDVSWVLHQHEPDRMNVELYGTEGGLRVYQPELYRFSNDQYEIVENPEAPALRLPHANRVHNFLNAILGTEEPLVSIAESIAVQKIIDGIYESSQTGNEVKL